MKIEVKPGHLVVFDARRSSSTRGGTYDLAKLQLSEKDVERVLAHPAVTVIEEKPAKSAKAKEEGNGNAA